MKIALSAESTIDLPQNLIEQYNIHTTPFTVLLGDEMYFDGEIEVEKMFEYTEKTKNLPKTSAVNQHQFTEHFEKLLKQYEAVIHFSLSSGVSCAYENALQASKKFDNVFVAGDIRKKELKQIITACSDGAIAATQAVKYLTKK